MSQSGSWGKLSTDQRARDAAREAAMAEGITLGEYLNRLLTTVDEPQPGETPYSYTRRTGIPQPPMPPAQAYEPARTPDPAATLDRITRRIEATEARSALTINGMDHTVHGLVARLQSTEQTTAAIAGHVEGLIEEMRQTHETLQTKVRRLEQDDRGQHSIEALRALESALGKLATHVFEEGELTQNETAAIKGRVEAGFADLSERVEGMEVRVDRTLSDAAARVERAVEQAELRAQGTTRLLGERMTTLESQLQERLSDAAPSEARLSAVEADVSGALNSMESTLLRIQDRLNRAENSTDTALKSLEQTFAHLDERIESVAAQVDPELASRLKAEFEQRFEDLTRSVRNAVDSVRLDLATEITKAAAGQAEKLEEHLRTEVSGLKTRLAEVEAREPADLSSTLQEEIGRLGSQVAERIDALAAHVEDRIEESELRSADAIEQVGEQVTVAAVRLQKRQDEALTALAQDIDGMRKASDARLSDALASVSERLERMQAQSSDSLSPVQRAIAALATRLESLEAFTTPPHVKPRPAALEPEFSPAFAAEPGPGQARDRRKSIFANIDDNDAFEAGVESWEVIAAKEDEGPYKSDLDGVEPPVQAARGDMNTYTTDLASADAGPGDPGAFDPIAELDAFGSLDDSLEGSHAETRESDIFDDEPDFTRTLAETESSPPLNASEDEATADYLARARRAAMIAAGQASRSKGRTAPVTKMGQTARPGNGTKVPMLLAASAVVISGAGVGGFLYLRGKQPVAPTLSGPIDTYVDPETGAASLAATTSNSPRPDPVDAEQILFEDEVALAAQTLLREAEPAVTAPAQPSGPAPKPIVSRMPPKPELKPAAELTPEQVAIKSIVTAAEAIQASNPPSPQPALPARAEDPLSEEAKVALARDTGFPTIPTIVTVEAEANAGNAVAQYQYAQVKLSEGDLETAASFLRRAAQKGIAPAQYELGKLYERGQGVEKDLIEARSLVQKAAEAGHVDAMYDYALFLAEGEGGAQSEAEVVAWFERAAERGHVDAQYNLGVVHAEGIGTDRNLAKALLWFEIAAIAGDEGAKQEVDNLRTRVSMTESLGAREAARQWKARAPDALANGKFGPQRWNTGNPLQVQAIQTALGRLGFGAGAPDGVLGPQTAEAISDYQRMEGLEETGTITPELVDHLNARAGGPQRS
ncbi:MAG: peptidoglycan-binding protein [Hyphomonas sp.]